MSTHSAPSPRNPMAVSAYERVSSLIIALILLIGFFVVLMFLIWLTRVMMFNQEAVPVTWVEEYAGRGEHAKGYERDLEEPGLEEMPELNEPQMEATLEAVTDAITTQAASLDIMETDALMTSHGTGVGDSRQAGPGGEGDDIIPRWERWRIIYSTTSLQSYARQLDHFNIELAAVGGGTTQVDYVSGVSQGQPRRRQVQGGKEEQRLYLSWASGEMKAFDEQLLRRAGARTDGRLILQFIPPDLEQRLAQLEQEYAMSKGIQSVKQIEQTVFRVRGDGGGFEFYVERQSYRQPRS